MRRLATLLALLVLGLLAGGCGADDEPEVTPLGDALGYFSKEAPLVAAVETDPDNAQVEELRSLVDRFQARGPLTQWLQGWSRFRFARYDRDVKPLLGAPLVLGLVRPTAGSLTAPMVAAIQVPDASEAKQSVLAQPGFAARGRAHGVRIYGHPGEDRFLAVDGDVLLMAAGRASLAQAIGMRRSDERMREDEFLRDVEGLPDGALARVSGDPRAMIAANPRLRSALDVKWLSSLRRLGATAELKPSGVSLNLRVRTDAGALDDDDLPFAPKPGALALLGGEKEVKAGMREPARLARFVADVWNAVAPRRAERLRRAAAGRIDWRRIVRHLADHAVIAFDPFTQRFAARVAVNEAADVREGLTEIAPALPDAAAALGRPGLGIATPEAGESFYALATPTGRTVVFGVVGQALVAASEAGRAAGLASEATAPAPGPPAAAVLTADARALAGAALQRVLGGAAGLIAPLVVAPLRDLTAKLAISRAELRVRARLAIVR